MKSTALYSHFIVYKHKEIRVVDNSNMEEWRKCYLSHTGMEEILSKPYRNGGNVI